MKKITLLLVLLGVSLGGAYLVLKKPAVKSPYARMVAASPVETIKPAKITNAPSRVAPVATNPEVIRQQQQERFTDLKEEGRRIRQALIDNNPLGAKAFQTIAQLPEYRQLVDRRHQIEAAWAAAPDGERDGMLTEINRLREQSVGMLLTEINRQKNLPDVPAVIVAPAGVTAAGGVPVVAPPAPVFQ
jgi:hypothetical protein